LSDRKTPEERMSRSDRLPLSKKHAAPPSQWKPVWSCCLGSILCLVALIAAALLLREWNRRSEYQYAKEWMEQQIAEIEEGKKASLLSPDPRFLEELLDEHPEAAAKVTELHLDMFSASDERFACLAQLPNLSKMYLYEVRDADTFLGHFREKPSVTGVSLCKTGISDEGMRAVASLPNLKRLHLDYFCKRVSLEPLRGHPSLEEIVFDEVEISPEWAAVLATMPKLRTRESK
jgi:hypothetical protein